MVPPAPPQSTLASLTFPTPMLRLSKTIAFSGSVKSTKLPQCGAKTAKPAKSGSAAATFHAKDASSMQKWLYQSKYKWRTYGLFEDDLIIDAYPFTKEAIRRLPEKVRAARDRRLQIALDLSVKQTPLPPDQWVKPEEDIPYLRPLVEEVTKEEDLRSTFRLDTPLLATKLASKQAKWKIAPPPTRSAAELHAERVKQLAEDKKAGKQLSIADDLVLLAHRSERLASSSQHESAFRLAQLAHQAAEQFALSPQEQVARSQLAAFQKELDLLSKPASS